MRYISERIEKIHSNLPILTLILLLSGILALGFTYTIVPTLVPTYGGGEKFHLDSYNDFTASFPWFSKTRLYITITANDPVNIYIDGNSTYNGSFYKLTIPPRTFTTITLRSNSSTSGRFIALQEPSQLLQIATWGYFAFSCAFSGFLIYKLRKQKQVT